MQHVDSDDYSYDYEAIFQDGFTDIDSSSDTEEILNSDSDEENKLLCLTKMGYSEAEAFIAMERCGLNSSIAELTDFICAAQMAKADNSLFSVEDRKTLCNNPNYKKSAKLTKMIRKALETYDDEPPLSVQKYVIDECQKWNLVWDGRNKVAPLEPDKVEILLGFHKNHIRGAARNMFLGGIKILSLLSEISDAEVAFYCIGIPLKTNALLLAPFLAMAAKVTVSPAASRYTPTYSTLPEPWKGEHHKFNSLNFLASQTT
ncbi:DNA (Cytosine-5)-methyltransferase DRM1/2 isoform 2 [Hibiscus syriacus]|uniref:DNA (Cytosine-5)-methyltransferase DRM1/2 isoform 2 n=1 Tax=Hibiscus syriacus TaxID=106335 RepID=A0A6A3CJ49_HIBSY|nr:DNA (Cytosine-5)-methyltransferase DRM1/2 isoform 2 [Hibiscus syriacus]